MNTPTTIHHLAHETLSEIFGFLHSKGLDFTCSTIYPWSLSLVCRSWRNVVLSTPRLWTNIRIEADPIHVSRIDTRHDTVLAAVELCLERSKGCPITIHLEAWTERTRQLIPRFLTPCFKQRERWKDVTFLFPINLLVPFLQDSKHQHRYPQLRSLSLCGLDVTKDFDWNALSDTSLFYNAPRLSTTRLVGFSSRLPNLSMPWSNITDLASDMNFSGVTELLDVLQLLPNLTSLEYAQYGIDRLSDEPRRRPRTVELLHLRRLSLSTHYFNLSSIFDPLHAPLLTEFEIHCRDSQWTDSFRAFLERSQCTITTFCLRNVPVDVASVLLSMLPSCEILKLEMIDFNHHLLHRLTRHTSLLPPTCEVLTTTDFGRHMLHLLNRRQVTLFVPRLKELHLTNATIEKGMESALISMVESRLRIPNISSGPWSKLALLHVDRMRFSGDPKLDFGLSVFDVLREHTWSDKSLSVLFEEGFWDN